MIGSGEQTSLFDRVDPDAEGRKLARTTDPDTSKEAATAIVKSLGSLQQRAVEAVETWPGKTANELSNETGDRDMRTIGRRLSECARKGLILRGKARPCSTTGRRATTWYPLSAARDSMVINTEDA